MKEQKTEKNLPSYFRNKDEAQKTSKHGEKQKAKIEMKDLETKKKLEEARMDLMCKTGRDKKKRKKQGRTREKR